VHKCVCVCVCDTAHLCYRLPPALRAHGSISPLKGGHWIHNSQCIMGFACMYMSEVRARSTHHDRRVHVFVHLCLPCQTSPWSIRHLKHLLSLTSNKHVLNKQTVITSHSDKEDKDLDTMWYCLGVWSSSCNANFKQPTDKWRNQLKTSTEAPAPSDQLDVAVVTTGKNDINTVRFLTQTARFVS